jgi:hypothetical protein
MQLAERARHESRRATPGGSRSLPADGARLAGRSAGFSLRAAGEGVPGPSTRRELRPVYGGGMGELGVGRGQIELLAALFHADAPNDVAPSAYNEDDPPGGLPASPLAPRPEATGFRWTA